MFKSLKLESSVFVKSCLALPLALLFAGPMAGCDKSDDKGKKGDKKGDKDGTESDDDTNGKDGKDGTKGKKDSSEGDSTPKAVGEVCEKDGDCKSKSCREVTFTNPLTNKKQSVKTCAACADDKACTDADKGIACVPTPKVSGTTSVTATYECSDGSKGMGCEGDKQCKKGLSCAAVTINGQKAEGITTCGECKTDADCKDSSKPVCKTQGITQLKPHNACVAADEGGKDKEGSGKNDGETCSGEGEAGNKECKNYCKSIVASIAICVRCLEDSHCGDGKKCTPLEVNPTNPASSKFPACEPK